MARLLISAAHKSSGKTTISTGLCAALAARGQPVQPFKKGPDYIDPLWLGRAAGRPCVNLDFNTMSHQEIREAVGTRTGASDVALIEGNKGLYDGLDLEGSNSNAALARLLQAPVVLVIDSRGVTRGVAPLLLGYQAFERDIQIAGVILNRVGGSRHGSKLRAVIEHYTDIPVLGMVSENADLQILERHLGLIPSNEHAAADAQIQRLARVIEAEVDVQRIGGLGQTAPPLPRAPATAPAPDAARVRIAVARDAAFGFYYATDLEALEQAGAELLFFDALQDTELPPADGLFIGGGFPESRMRELEANASMRESVRAAIESGLPAYAECGGLMYLARGITWNGTRCAMAGVLPGEVVMHARPQGRGYVRLEETGQLPWPAADSAPDVPDSRPFAFGAHEFHYSALEPMPAGTVYAYRVLRGHGIDGRHDGIVYRNLLASYSHLRHSAQNPWADRFVAFVRGVQADRSRRTPIRTRSNA
ncbi:cobyrinate a,c-diamide synthase [Thioalkalivibrio paradoxus]|uniref:Cobyrinate a,c-diamide synthase n=1 Tax=Thioalkalivibrio paradoxus ARh 1 TaxID=713585 RepID=W0DNN6_9GAMM|nr:cobyrinate a,c-diamide synthase [Thioalkalivibrio paradoxus]AHE98862.1 hydrogenase expression protein HypE [Thioalkalivibrio paradoxus ARh 1]